MKKLFLDTSVIIDFLRRKDQENSLLFLFTQKSYSLAISIITYAELFSGKSVWENEKCMKLSKKSVLVYRLSLWRSKHQKAQGEYEHNMVAR